MLLAQRGAQKGADDYGAFVDAAPTQVLRYTSKIPTIPRRRAYGRRRRTATRPATRQVGVRRSFPAYAYRPDGTLDANACQGTVALTADGITEDGKGHGAQHNAVDLVLPANLPPKQSAFIDFDAGRRPPTSKDMPAM